VGAAICRRHPPMRSTVIDLPQAVPHARALAAREGIADIVEYRPGNLMTDDFGTGWDVVVLSNILHHFEPPQIARILGRAGDAAGPDATVAIWEVERPERGARPSVGDGAALFFRLTSTAGAYHGSEYARWLADAGFTGVTITRSRAVPGDVLVCGRRPSNGRT